MQPAAISIPSITVAPAPIIEKRPTVTPPQIVAPGATCTQSSSKTSCSMVLFVLTIAPRPMVAPLLMTAPSITTAPSPPDTPSLTIASGETIKGKDRAKRMQPHP